MVRRAYCNGVDAFFLLEHNTEVLVAFRAGKTLERLAGPSDIYVAECHEPAARPGQVFHLTGPFAANTDTRQVEAVIGAPGTLGNVGERKRGCCCGQKIAATDSSIMHLSTFLLI